MFLILVNSLKVASIYFFLEIFKHNSSNIIFIFVYTSLGLGCECLSSKSVNIFRR